MTTSVLMIDDPGGMRPCSTEERQRVIEWWHRTGVVRKETRMSNDPLVDVALKWLAARDASEAAIREQAFTQDQLRRYTDAIVKNVPRDGVTVIQTPRGDVRVVDGGVFKDGVIPRV